MALVFEAVARDVVKRAIHTDGKTDALLRELDRRARIVLGLFSRQDQITANDVARVLNLSPRQSRDLLNEWVAGGSLEMTSASRKSCAYELSAVYRRFIGGIMADAQSRLNAWQKSQAFLFAHQQNKYSFNRWRSNCHLSLF